MLLTGWMLILTCIKIIAIERYVGIVHPFKRMFNGKFICFMIVVNFILGFIIVSPSFRLNKLSAGLLIMISTVCYFASDSSIESRSTSIWYLYNEPSVWTVNSIKINVSKQQMSLYDEEVFSIWLCRSPNLQLGLCYAFAFKIFDQLFSPPGWAPIF